MPKILAYAHSTSQCRKILADLNLPDENKYVVDTKASIINFAELLKSIKPDYVIAIGTYGRNAKQIKIEAKCNNIFRGKLQGNEFIEYDINYFFRENEYFKVSKTIGGYYCNLGAYYIMKTINENKLKVKYSFLHISKKLNSELVIKAINQQLKYFYNI